jgi:DNA integrity scanning protein DisA with diadenylate cyclase activity
VDVLVQLAASMRAHRRGGALLVVPAGSQAWRDSIVGPVLYGVDPPFSELADLIAREGTESQSHEWQEDLRRAVGAIAGLTAVDGATIITDRYELVAFGAKITRRRGSAPVERVIVTEPVEGSQTETVAPAQFGGTRHLSAAQFVNDQRDAIALVASQDGRFTIFRWSPAEDMVHAHRVEALLI